jgi:dTDP-4-dehydrorhamnose 3,5-epimerase
MQFTELEIPGLHLVDLDWIGDDRGGFAKVFSREQLTEAGLYFDVVDHNFSRSKVAGTIRGLHYQTEPHAEIKFIRCARGALVDVVVDMRPDSPTYGKWRATELNAESHQMLYVPKGLAHGFQTLVDDTYASYYSSAAWAPDAEAGVRWNDPGIGIEWPLDPGDTMSEKDRNWPDVDLSTN